MILICRKDNNLYRALINSGYDCRILDSMDSALVEASTGECILALADEYPKPGISISEEQLNLARAKRVRLYLEYPESVNGLEIGGPCPTRWERAVVSSDFFMPALQNGRILTINGCWYLPVNANNPLISIAKVAGYNNAVYGLTPDAFPILFMLDNCRALIATSKLSQFITGRYGPAEAWKSLWQRIIRWLMNDENTPELLLAPSVTPAYSIDDYLPENAEGDAFNKCVDWFNSEAVFSVDDKKGVIEGFESAIDYRGRQKRRTWLRSDCIGESGMVFACDWALNRNPESKNLAEHIIDYTWSSPDFLQNDPDSPVYGLVNWFERGPVFYGDDDARVILSTIATANLLQNNKWDEHALRCIVANYRTTGSMGFRRPRLDMPGSFKNGEDWCYYHQEEFIHYAPHYQAYLWAALLLAYESTGFEGFYSRPLKAIKMTMEAYPKWRWTNGLTQEMARMLLPLAFLIRIDDKPEYRAWLKQITGDLFKLMQPCGAIREKMGRMEDGSYPSPRSNETYGVSEASIIQEDGDPACDLLYTMNYAFLGLHEAAATTGDREIRQAEDKLAEFLCRIQAKSKKHSFLEGAWLRCFDYNLWEYWGSSADLGWGVWSVETGWTNTWIASVLAMRQIGTCLFDSAKNYRLKAILPKIIDEMMQKNN